MSTFSSSAGMVRFWFWAIIAILGATVMTLEGGRRFLVFVNCPVEYPYGVLRVAGYDFDARVVDCRFSPYGVVFLSRPGGGKKTRLLEYSGVEFPPAEPRFRKIDEHTVEVFLPIVGKVFCLRGTWGALRIKYEFLRIEYPRYDDEDHLPACSR